MRAVPTLGSILRIGRELLFAFMTGVDPLKRLAGLVVGISVRILLLGIRVSRAVTATPVTTIVANSCLLGVGSD